MTPLKKPIKVPITMPNMIATGIGIPLFTINPTVNVPETATVAPTERSIPPKIIINVIPRAKKTLLDTCLKTVMRLSAVKNTGDTIDKTIHKINNTKIIPALFLNMVVKALFALIFIS
ncbi:hypothetical protein D3C77_512760 [compost metagenome]